jgi:hypothetical protein
MTMTMTMASETHREIETMAFPRQQPKSSPKVANGMEKSPDEAPALFRRRPSREKLQPLENV